MYRYNIRTDNIIGNKNYPDNITIQCEGKITDINLISEVKDGKLYSNLEMRYDKKLTPNERRIQDLYYKLPYIDQKKLTQSGIITKDDLETKGKISIIETIEYK
jgi:hypothetical protein